MSPKHLRRRPGADRHALCAAAALLALLSALPGAARAQSPSPNGGAAEITPGERAKRDAEKVFQWIRIHSDKPRKAAPTSSGGERPAAPVAAAVQPAPVRASRAAAKAADKGITETVQSPAADKLAAEKAGSTTAPGPALQPEPVTAAMAAPRDAAAPVADAAPPVVEEDMPLVALVKPEPEFSPNLMRQLRKGMVQVSFTVQPDGSVTQARAVSSTHPRLVQTALSTVSQWRFRPPRHAQQAVVDLGFNLE